MIIAPDADDEALAIVAREEEPAPAARRRAARPARADADRALGRRRPAGAGPRQRRARRGGAEGRDQARADRGRAAPTSASPGGSCKHVKSNAIVYVKDGATVGVGAGQMSRVDSARIAARKAEDAARAAGWRAADQGSVVASDAFFPFADGLVAAVEAGATAVIQPGGSMRDAEVIAAADAAGIAMVFTGMRHFRH